MPETGASLLQSVRNARAVSLDAKAFRLIDSYIEKLDQGLFNELLGSQPLPWPLMWTEFEDDGRTVGVLYEENDKVTRAQFFYRGLTVGAERIVPPTMILEIDPSTKTYMENPSEALVNSVKLVDIEGQKSIYDGVTEDRVRMQKYAMQVSVLATLLLAENILNVEPERRLKLDERRRAERAGKRPPASKVSTIDLSDIGKREYKAVFPEDPDVLLDENDVGAESHRRAHWVRGHMFIARNSKLTYRRPHMRGVGSPHQSEVRVTASRT